MSAAYFLCLPLVASWQCFSEYKPRGTTASAVHPEFISGGELLDDCDVGNNLPPRTPRTLLQGCTTVLLAALDPFLTGHTLSPRTKYKLRDRHLTDEAPALMVACEAAPAKEYATSSTNKDKLWNLSGGLVESR
ncbi:hypothetical protein EV356DRAFT_513555 [Viridothelium virens]|uniref:Uncharacterized protein n=1 Tax=Viridothelium virens TaxID=1048519 RepID=A0A6A6HCX9_VIRVR|nr:hypothetical protein EV356DRAFT_513555 [Viridothelium virens]